MDTLTPTTAASLVSTYALPLLWKVAGAIVLWLAGAMAIRVALAALSKTLGTRGIDATLASYLGSALGGVLKIFLLLALLSVFGIETTSFAAMLAAAGVAIGMAWAGLLANFAAGIFLVVLRPFKTGDMVSAAGVTGVVKEIGLFATLIETPDSVLTFAGNNRIFGDNIVNYSRNPVRRVDRTAQLAHGVDAADAKRRILAKLEALPHVAQTPGPSVGDPRLQSRGHGAGRARVLPQRPLLERVFRHERSGRRRERRGGLPGAGAPTGDAPGVVVRNRTAPAPPLMSGPGDRLRSQL